MKRKYDQIYQFKISLRDTKPPIWRRIQVPSDYTFRDLHVAIQDAMGWCDYHLHEFKMKDPATGETVEIGIPDEDMMVPDANSGWGTRIAHFYTPENPRALYIYDFGDYWEHEVTLEKILPRGENVMYPVCTGGRRACPPEDCGGIPGFEHLLEILADPGHEDHEDMLDWLEEPYDATRFDPRSVRFTDRGKQARKSRR